MSTTTDTGRKLDPCPRCGEGDEHMRIADLCFGCWYVEHGAEEPDKLIAIVQETARQRGAYKDERNALVAAFVELGVAMEAVGTKLVAAKVTVNHVA